MTHYVRYIERGLSLGLEARSCSLRSAECGDGRRSTLLREIAFDVASESHRLRPRLWVQVLMRVSYRRSQTFPKYGLRLVLYLL